LLSLAGGASAAIVGPAEPTEDTASRHVITLSEEEIFDVSLSTFYVFDKENAGTHHPDVQLAAERRGGRTAVAAEAAPEAAEAAEHNPRARIDILDLDHVDRC
jgi:hypothetical protein